MLTAQAVRRGGWPVIRAPAALTGHCKVKATVLDGSQLSKTFNDVGIALGDDVELHRRAKASLWCRPETHTLTTPVPTTGHARWCSRLARARLLHEY